MSKIKGKDTRPEMLVRKFLFANGSLVLILKLKINEYLD